eukprot:3930618-Prymnesium_polylepis.2
MATAAAARNGRFARAVARHHLQRDVLHDHVEREGGGEIDEEPAAQVRRGHLHSVGDEPTVRRDRRVEIDHNLRARAKPKKSAPQ